MSAPVWKPSWSEVGQPPCMPGCESAHDWPFHEEGFDVDPGEWLATGSIDCVRTVLRDQHMVVEVGRGASLLSATNWRVQVDPVRLLFRLRDDEYVEAADARQLVARLSAAIEEAAALADQLNGGSA